MRIAVGIAGAFILLAGSRVRPPKALPGNYQVRGQNLDGSAYSGTAEIVATSETTCRIVWKTGGTTANGICMRNGDSFAAGYVLGESVGLVVYKMNAAWDACDDTSGRMWRAREAPARLRTRTGQVTALFGASSPHTPERRRVAGSTAMPMECGQPKGKAARALTLLAARPSISRIILI